MDELIDYREEQDEEGALVISNGRQSMAVVGVLTSKTTPEDFKRFHRLAVAWRQRRKLAAERSRRA